MIRYFMVGGYVRDQILGVKSKDIDFAVEAPSFEAMRDDLLKNDVLIWQERPEFLTIRGRHPKLGAVDYTLCRKDGVYTDYRHPDSVQIGTIFDDLARRDFTINAIAIDEGGAYIDPHNGRNDILSKNLYCVGKAEDRFSEDALRLMRAVRFHIVKGFHLSPPIERALMDEYIIGRLRTIPKERIYEELKKCFEKDTWSTIEFFDDYRDLKNLIFDEIGIKLIPGI